MTVLMRQQTTPHSEPNAAPHPALIAHVRHVLLVADEKEALRHVMVAFKHFLHGPLLDVPPVQSTGRSFQVVDGTLLEETDLLQKQPDGSGVLGVAVASLKRLLADGPGRAPVPLRHVNTAVQQQLTDVRQADLAEHAFEQVHRVLSEVLPGVMFVILLPGVLPGAMFVVLLPGVMPVVMFVILLSGVMFVVLLPGVLPGVMFVVLPGVMPGVLLLVLPGALSGVMPGDLGRTERHICGLQRVKPAAVERDLSCRSSRRHPAGCHASGLGQA